MALSLRRGRQLRISRRARYDVQYSQPTRIPYATKVGNHSGPSSFLLWVSCLLLGALTPTWAQSSSATLWSVSRIEIHGTQRTHDQIVRRELLFAVGDTVDAALIEETERNLRRLLFLGDVHLRLIPDLPSTSTATAAATNPPPISEADPWAARESEIEPARVVVEVAERYARALSPLLEGESNELSFGVVALDYNFLGRAQVTQVTLFHDAIAGNEVRTTYREPRLGGSRLALRLSVAWAGDEGHDVSMSLSQPFYALDTRWAYGLSMLRDRQRQRLYLAGDLAARYDDQATGSALWLVHSRDVGPYKLRPGLRLAFSDRSFAADAPFTYQPTERRRVVPSLSVTLWRPRYSRERFVRGLGHMEDLQTGGWLTAQAGMSARSLGSDRNYPVFAIQWAPRGRPTDDSFLFGVASVSSRWRDGTPWHVIASAVGSGYLRLWNQHVLAARIAIHALHRPEDTGSQLLLGIDTGLRGYSARQFDGSRRALASIEARPVFWRHPQAVIGAALFADAGTAWTPGLIPRRWVSSVGAGLRLGLPTVYDAPVLRADLAHGLDGARLQMSLGLGHAF